MRLYHGSTIDISYVDLAKSKPNKDFGRAFYLSDDEQQNPYASRETTENSVNYDGVYEGDDKIILSFSVEDL